MALRTVKIVNCKTASIRRTPWIPLYDKNIAGMKKGSTNDEDSVKQGSSIVVDTDDIQYDWTGRKFYRVVNPKGWIYEGCIDLIITGDDSDE